MKVYPKAQVTIGRVTRPPRGGVPRGNIHTTETPSSGFYTRTVYYSIQVREYLDRVFWRQFMDLLDYSWALRHNSGDPQTNQEGSVNPSLSIVGYAKNMPFMSDLLAREIAEFMVWCEVELGIPARFVAESHGGQCYGENSPCHVRGTDRLKSFAPTHDVLRIEARCGNSSLRSLGAGAQGVVEVGADVFLPTFLGDP